MEAPAQIPRRRFLISGAALLGAGALGLPTRAFAEAPAILTARRGLDGLAAQLKGRLIRPGEEGYAMAAFPNNARWAEVRPRAIAMCADPDDVQACIRWLQDEQDNRFAIRSGGHNYAGFSTTEGLLIDVKPMNGIRFDGSTVTIQGGVNNQNMADALRRTNLAIPSGRCPTVGASGLVLGGGWGFSATHSGLTCDALLETEIVLASGERVVANNHNQHRDLFWGLRGGGGGNFGVNTSFTFKLHEVGPVTIFNITWPAEHQVELLMTLQDIQLRNATQISTRTKAVPSRLVPQPGRELLEVTTLGQFFGDSHDFEKVMAPAFKFGRPVYQDVRTMEYWQARDYLITDDPTGMYDIRCSYVAEMLPERAIERMLQWMSRWPGGSLLPENMGILFAIGGKVRHPEEPTAYAHRNANFIFEMERSWAPIDKREVVEAQERWLNYYYADMQEFLLPQSYVNFPNRDLRDWQNAYYAGNLAELRCLKLQYDPENLFRFQQSIPLPDLPGSCPKGA